MTNWLEGTAAAKQMRGHLQASFSSQKVILVILPFVREKGDLSNGVASPAEQQQFTFRPADASLQLSAGEFDQSPLNFACKPWVKQKWWSIY